MEKPMKIPEWNETLAREFAEQWCQDQDARIVPNTLQIKSEYVFFEAHVIGHGIRRTVRFERDQDGTVRVFPLT